PSTKRRGSPVRPKLPDFKSSAEGILDHVFSQGDVMDAEDPCQSRNHSPGFTPEQVLAKHAQTLTSKIGRTSTMPSSSKIGQPFARSTACSRSSAMTIVNPPTISFSSAKGPSVTAFCLPCRTLSTALKRVARIAEVALIFEHLHPGQPLL